MARLIDADAMNEELFYKQLGGKDTLITAESAFNMIKAQPTAYDVDAVVEKIQNIHLPLASQTTRIIGIVRKGGVDG